jgi:3-dehydroquinate synthase
MSEVRVNLGKRSYVITIERGALASVGAVVQAVRRPSVAAVVSNPAVAGYYADAVLESLHAAGINAELVLVPSGERFKTLNTVRKVYESLLDMRMDRRGAVIALGGGVIGDTAGFAAATYMRGVDFYQVPTTLLAQVDASVGGKTGVDLPRGKNLVGAFYQPKAVVIDVLTLRTLPPRELRSGLAEVIKHGIIYGREFHDYLDAHAADLLARREDVLAESIRRSVEIKRDVVEADECEAGLRAILNYGHTVAHAIETVSGYGRYRHGEALSVGMVTEALLAERQGVAKAGLAASVAGTLAKVRLPVRMDPSLSTEDMIRAIELDKKTLGGELRLALPVRIGECKVFTISREALAGAIKAHISLSPCGRGLG